MKFFSSMMKCGSVLFFLLFFVGTVAADGPPSRKYKTHNWENSMGSGGWSTEQGGGSGHMCVNLLADNILHIKLYIHMEDTTSLRSMREMRFKYSASINGIPLGTGYTPVAVRNDFVPVYVNGVIDYYTATYNIPYDLTVHCQNGMHLPNPDNEHDFTITYQMVYINQSGLDIAYPVGSYPSAWPPSEYNIPSSLVDEPVSDTKNVCCYNIKPLKKEDDGSLMASDGAKSQVGHQNIKADVNSGSAASSTALPKVKDVLVAPNPFNDDLNLQFMVNQAGNTKLELIDMQGRIFNRVEHNATSLGLQAVQMNAAGLAPGIYYLRLSNNDQTHLVKLLKTGN